MGLSLLETNESSPHYSASVRLGAHDPLYCCRCVLTFVALELSFQPPRRCMEPVLIVYNELAGPQMSSSPGHRCLRLLLWNSHLPMCFILGLGCLRAPT